MKNIGLISKYNQTNAKNILILSLGLWEIFFKNEGFFKKKAFLTLTSCFFINASLCYSIT